MNSRARRDLIPNANSPQLLTRLVEAVAQGVRSSRGLQEVLGVSLRTVNYYTQAAEWLGLVDTDGEVCLTPLGLEFAYAGEERAGVYARAVWATPFVAELLTGREHELPEVTVIAAAIAKREPDLAPATVLRRAGAVRSLMAPAMAEAGAPPRLQPHQLALPLGLSTEASAPPRIDHKSKHEYNPDVYRYLLASLLDHGELDLGQVRGLLDKAQVADAPIGGYVDLALKRGDAVRHSERLVASLGAIARRGMVDTTTSVVLSDPGYRAYLRDVRDADADGAARVRRDGARSRYLSWDKRLFGHAVDPSTIESDLEHLLMDRSLDSFPVAGGAAVAPDPEVACFLDVWHHARIPVAAPPTLATLSGGVPLVNRVLKKTRTASGVGEPGIATRPVVFHGGLLHPGEALPRSVPDTRSLRVRLLANAPFAALLAALLLLHRHRSDRFELTSRKGGWEVLRRRKRLGPVMDVLDSFAQAREWIVCRRRTGGLTAGQLIDVFEALGMASEVGNNAVLAESFFAQLRTEAEEMELLDKLLPLSEALAQFLEETPVVSR